MVALIPHERAMTPQCSTNSRITSAEAGGTLALRGGTVDMGTYQTHIRKKNEGNPRTFSIELRGDIAEFGMPMQRKPDALEGNNYRLDV